MPCCIYHVYKTNICFQKHRDVKHLIINIVLADSIGVQNLNFEEPWGFRKDDIFGCTGILCVEIIVFAVRNWTTIMPSMFTVVSWLPVPLI